MTTALDQVPETPGMTPVEQELDHTASPLDRPVVARLDRVSRRFGDIVALRDVDLTVHSGEIVALLGPNGAGKTTAISLLTGLRSPDSGSVQLFGGDPRHPDARRGLGVTPQETGFPQALRVAEVLDFARAHYADPADTDDLLTRFGLTHLANRSTGRLSVGERRRLAVALAFSGQPRLVVLDEPTAGLDVEARRMVWQGVRQFALTGGTVLLTTHYIEEAEALATRVLVLRDGQIVADGSVSAIRASVALRRVTFRAQAVPRFANARVTSVGQHHTVDTPAAEDVVRELVRSGIPFHDLEVFAVRLEDAVLQLTERPQ